MSFELPSEKNSLIIGGFLPFTTIDFPTVLASCVVFCQGCGWRCSYCQNKDLQPIQLDSRLSWSHIFAQITERKDFLDGVVFSGGEPLYQEALLGAVQAVKELGLKVALHTSGAIPERLANLVPLLDWVGFDIKAPFNKYCTITGISDSGELAQKSLHILLDSSVEFECRTTVDPTLLTFEDVLEIAQNLHTLGVKTFAIQPCFDDTRLLKYSSCFQNENIATLRSIFPNLIVR